MDKLEQDVRAQLGGIGPWSEKYDVSGTTGMSRKLERAGRRSKRLIAAVAAVLLDPDLDLRSAAVEVVSERSKVMGSEVIADALIEHPALFYGVKPHTSMGSPWAWPLPDLAAYLLLGLSVVVGRDDARAKALLREAPTRYGPQGWVWYALATGDGEWLVAHSTDAIAEEDWLLVLRDLPTERLQRGFLKATLHRRSAKAWERLFAEHVGWATWRKHEARPARLERFIRRELAAS